MPEEKPIINLKDNGIKIPDFSNLQKPTQIIESTAKKENYLNINLNNANSSKRMEHIKNIDPAHYGLRTIFFGFLSIITFLSMYFIYDFSMQYLNQNLTTTEQKLLFENPLVRASASRVISIEAGATKDAIKNIVLQAAYNEKTNPEEIILITPSYLREVVIAGEKRLEPELMRGDDFLFTFTDKAPLALRTTMGNEYAYGVTNNQRLNKLFLAFSVATPQDANKELLKWENEMYSDLQKVLSLREVRGNINFRDLSVNNHALRVAEDGNGIIFMYGFGSPRSIIFSTDIETYEKVYINLK